MLATPLAENEAARIAALHSFGLLDTPKDPVFDALAATAASLCNAAAGLVTAVDTDRQWFKAAVGLEAIEQEGATETSREISFCTHAIVSNDDVFVVRDTTLDARFAQNPLVTAQHGIRFYAGAPVVTADGFRLGTVCVVDTKPRELAEHERKSLRGLADLAIKLLETQRDNSHALEAARRTVESIGDAVVVSDTQGNVTYLNPIAEELSGWTSDEAQGRPVNEVLWLTTTDPTAGSADPIRECLASGMPLTGGSDVVLKSAAGSQHVIAFSVSPISGTRGGTVGAVLVFRDVTDAAEQRSELEFQARHDGLTGASNRYEFERALAAVVNDANTSSAQHALLYLDLDEFKAINDRFGHNTGDYLLRKVTEMIKEHVRANDLVARLGGDEFGIVLRNCTADQALAVGADIAASIAELGQTIGDSRTRVAASIGVVAAQGSGFSEQQLMKAADQACYSAKRAGGGAARLYSLTDVNLGERETWGS